MTPTPAIWLSVPESNIDRVGLHAEAVWTSEYQPEDIPQRLEDGLSDLQSESRIPSLAKASRFGVRISPP